MLRILAGLIVVTLPLCADLTPAELRIAAAERALERTPESAARLNDLALAYTRRARETADVSLYDRALEIVKKSFEIRSENYGAQRVRVWALLGKHEFALAYDEAMKLRAQAPDDVMAYGLLADAAIELGRYDEALDAVQWMLDLRPGNVAGLTRAAYLRELHGWTAGAAELMRQALDRTPRFEQEDRAWVHVQLAHLERQRDNPAAAERHATQALELFPGYHYALAELGRIRMSQGRHAEAVEAFAERYEGAPHPENLYDLARAQQSAGLTEEAAVSFARFAEGALVQSGWWDNANRELVAYLVEHDPEQALEIAERDFARRRDVFTRDSYAWALHHAGRPMRAREEMVQVLELGVRDKRILEHAAALGVDVPASADFMAARR